MISLRNAVVAGMVVGIGLLGNAFGQESWTVKSPIPNLNNVIWAGTQFVAVGYEGAIFTSSDGTAWTRKISGTSRNLKAAAWTGNKIVVVGDSVVTTSVDGTGWTATATAVAANFNAVTWTGTQFIAVGGGIYSSTDGISWVNRNSSFYGYSVTFGNNLIIVAGGDVATSSDGIFWTKRDSTNGSYSSVVWTGTKFVVYVSGGILTSTDGIIWSRKSFAVGSSIFSTLAWTGNQFVVGTSTSNADGIFTSPDAINWTIRKAPLPVGYYISAIASSPSGQIIAVGRGTILSSSDGITWVSRTSGISNNLISIAGTSDKWVAFSYENNVFSSSDLSVWSNTHFSAGSDLGAYSITAIWTGTQFVIIAHQNINATLFISPDGINVKQCITNIPNINGAANGPMLVTVGNKGSIVTSADGGNSWIYRNSGTECNLKAISWTGTQFVAVGDYAIIITSPDGINWTRRYASLLNNLTSVMWTGSQLIAVGAKGAITSSIDGTTWTIQNSGDTVDLFSIAGTATRMAAVGYAYSFDANGSSTTTSLILSSRDGITWTKRNSGTTNKLCAIAYADSQFVAVGDNGTVLVSPLSTSTVAPLAKSVAPVFSPQLNRRGITIELGAGRYTLSIIDMAGRILYHSSGISTAAGRRIFNPDISTNCCIVKLDQGGLMRAKKLMMVD